MDTTPTPLLEWSAPIQPIVIRTQRWYVIAGGVVLAVAAYGILSGSWPLAVVSILCGAIYFLLRNHTPRMAQCAFYEAGILYDGTFRRWEEFGGFWILQTPVNAELRLAFRRSRGEVKIQMPDTMDPQALRLALGSFLTELTDRKESLIDIFTRIAKL